MNIFKIRYEWLTPYKFMKKCNKTIFHSNSLNKDLYYISL